MFNITFDSGPRSTTGYADVKSIHLEAGKLTVVCSADTTFEHNTADMKLIRIDHTRPGAVRRESLTLPVVRPSN